VVVLFPLFVDVLDVVLDFYLFLSTLESVGVQEFTVESSDLFGLLEEFSVGFGEFLFLDLVLELLFLLVHSSSFELLLLELFEPLFFLAFFEILEVVAPLVRAFLALLVEIVGAVLLGVAWIGAGLPEGMRLARIFILVSSSCVMVMAPFVDMRKLYFIY
jgi:hypothetical protein